VASSPAERLEVAIARIAEATRDRVATGRSHHDADSDLGTIESDDAIGFDPRPVLRALAEHGAPAVVIGQVAGILHGSDELTGDLDLLWSGTVEEGERMAAAFTSLGATLFDDDGVPIDEAVRAFQLPKVLFRTRTASGDCCTPGLPWGHLDVSAFLSRAERTEIDRIAMRYVTLPDLMSLRRASGRPKDLRRLAELESFLAQD
jgi:hypothetical protein